MKASTQPQFWRDNELPFVELRHILDGHKVRYAPHYHEQWSIGAILKGDSSYLCADQLYEATTGDLVVMNPHLVHACNPKDGSPWSYYMMHIDTDWLAELLYREGIRVVEKWQPSQVDWLSQSALFKQFNHLALRLFDDESTTKEKQDQLERFLLDFFYETDRTFQKADWQQTPEKLIKVANFILEHCHLEMPIEDIATNFGFSASYLTRQFKQFYHMTPHAYRLNRRVQLGQIALKNGQTIAEVAQTFGFSDQAHFQRVFKERVAATPLQYRI